ncbi:MAG TPA: hypothetical protein VFN09_00700 [Rhodanobacteraceae bacterium]|nr:hypothetical protein [Rhodanobacteraceae bacterium]
MKLIRADLDAAATQGVIGTDQAVALWSFLEQVNADRPGFRAAHILHYLGGLLAIMALGWFLPLGWEAFGGWGLMTLALSYAALGVWVLHRLQGRAGMAIPAGVVATFVLSLTPLAVYGAQVGLGYWAEGRGYHDYYVYIDWRWILMELATLLVGAVMLWKYRLPYLVMPVAFTLWYLSMDLVPFLYGEGDPSWELRRFVSMWFGLGILLLALWVDLRSRRDKDYAFWLYLFGAIAFWSGLTLMGSDSEIGKFFYLLVNLVMLAVGAMLGRRVFGVFGGLGVAGYVGHLAWRVFDHSLLFPLVLVAVGFAIVWLGVLWQRHECALSTRLRALLPVPLRELVERAG